MLRKYITSSNVLFALLIFMFLYPRHDGKIYLLLAGFTAAVKIIQLIIRAVLQNDEQRKSADDVLAIFYLVFGSWHLFSARIIILSKMLFPEPEIVFLMFINEIPDMMQGLINSLVLLISGYLLALAAAVPAGIFVGWNRRLYRMVDPYAKVLGPIPPIVYIPYAIALLPSFRSASIFVIFLGAFWPIFINTIHGVLIIPRNLIDSARVLNLNRRTLFIKVILPGAMPSICTGANLSLLFSFLMLTAAELIGANSGIGWYVRNFGDFGDYPRVIAGLIFIGIIVTLISWGAASIERYLLKWTDTRR